jgi:hypothetical protein
MTLSQYEQRFMIELEDIWNDSAKFKYMNWNAFISAMHKIYEESEDEN